MRANTYRLIIAPTDLQIMPANLIQVGGDLGTISQSSNDCLLLRQSVETSHPATHAHPGEQTLAIGPRHKPRNQTKEGGPACSTSRCIESTAIDPSVEVHSLFGDCRNWLLDMDIGISRESNPLILNG